ncbi:MAG: ferrous iron transport protein A [Bacteroidetes bacterium]|nr:ferrous iron transport protein A [Bacteroidota bacterium]MCL6098667.1 ferrous iron transport protein A [Bacteroidota bacterium]
MNSTLDKAKKGVPVTVVKLPAGDIKSQLIRLGISEGDTFKCLERLPGGTIVVQKNRQEIAVGFDLAKKIQVILQK